MTACTQGPEKVWPSPTGRYLLHGNQVFDLASARRGHTLLKGLTWQFYGWIDDTHVATVSYRQSRPAWVVSCDATTGSCRRHPAPAIDPAVSSLTFWFSDPPPEADA